MAAIRMLFSWLTEKGVRRHISISILTLFDTFLSKKLDLLDGWAIDFGWLLSTSSLGCHDVPE
jgi:hypothetical protein